MSDEQAYEGDAQDEQYDDGGDEYSQEDSGGAGGQDGGAEGQYDGEYDGGDGDDQQSGDPASDPARSERVDDATASQQQLEYADGEYVDAPDGAGTYAEPEEYDAAESGSGAQDDADDVEPDDLEDEDEDQDLDAEGDGDDGGEKSAAAILGSMLKPPGADGSDGGDADGAEGDAGDGYGKRTSAANFEDEADGSGEGEVAIFQDLQQTLQQLAATQSSPDQEQTVARLNNECDKLHRLFIGSRKNEKTLMKKCRELTAELSANASKVQAALKLSQNDRSTIASLRKEVKKAWKMVESASEKEARAKDVVNSLKNEIEALRSTMAEQGMAPSSAVPSSSNFARNKLLELQMEQEDQLRKEKQTLEQELANASSEIRTLKIEIEEQSEKVTSLMSERTLMDEEMLTLKDLLASKKAEQDRDMRSRGKIEQTLKQTMEAWEKREAEMKIKIGETKSLRDHVTKLEMQLQNERVRLEKSDKDREQMSTRFVRLQQEYDDQVLTTQRLLNENHEQGRDLKAGEEELSRLKENFKLISRAKETLTKKLKGVEESRMGAEMERDSLRSTNSHLNHDIEGLLKELEQTKKSLEMASRERDIAQKNFVKATGATQKQFNVLKLAEQTQRKLEQEIQGYKDEAQKMRKLIYTLEKDRDNKINEASRLDQVIMTKDEEMKMKDMIIFDSKKKIIEFERKLKEQQALYENVRADRNVYSKNLIESQDEITEMKRKLKIMNHQVEQLKEEIASKEAVLVKEHFEHSKLEKEKEALSIQIGKLQQQYEEAQQMIQNRQAEENKLRHIITEADAERLRQKKEYDAVVQERDILGTQLIRRNDELSLLYEKIKIQTSTLNKGEIQYRERLEDIRVLRLEIKRLRREKAILQTETQNVDSLRNEIFRLQRDVLRERTRVKVLEEELESPMNIHRWRKLAGSDPSTYELVTKIQTLQKRLIAKTEEVVEKELVIQQKEKLYKEVKEVLQRQPGPEVVEELRVVRDAVKTKMRECKALASELNMYHSQVNEYKYEVERLSRELQDLKKKYYQLRKRHQAEKRAEANSLKDRVLLPIGVDRVPYTPGAAEAMFAQQQQQQQQQPLGHHYGDDGAGGAVGMGGSLGTAKIGSRAATTDKPQPIKPNPPSGPRFSGGGFNMSTGPQQVVHLVTADGARDQMGSHQGVLSTHDASTPSLPHHIPSRQSHDTYGAVPPPSTVHTQLQQNPGAQAGRAETQASRDRLSSNGSLGAQQQHQQRSQPPSMHSSNSSGAHMSDNGVHSDRHASQTGAMDQEPVQDEAMSASGDMPLPPLPNAESKDLRSTQGSLAMQQSANTLEQSEGSQHS
ncbi:hypothetical protein HK105_205168 [Polyrhizophydium stewartii]|uniref:Cilia- and flagella-associated protein 58 central coiled coil domain-containing protein n=1 Tax=Polyrhizophydium stewartii TaxID=2732419 RepID=A0ABR4N6X0_9FUNG|nr:hypothetical protein HK105_000537 [Polyrhizophydium stewartii]